MVSEYLVPYRLNLMLNSNQGLPLLRQAHTLIRHIFFTKITMKLVDI